MSVEDNFIRRRPSARSGTVRHSVATRLDKAGLSAREIADYLGHERISMTQDVYMSRKATGANASAALDAFGPESVG